MRGRSALLRKDCQVAVFIFHAVPPENDSSFETVKNGGELAVLDMAQSHEVAEVNGGAGGFAPCGNRVVSLNFAQVPRLLNVLEFIPFFIHGLAGFGNCSPIVHRSMDTSEPFCGRCAWISKI